LAKIGRFEKGSDRIKISQGNPMVSDISHPVIEGIWARMGSLTPKGKTLAQYIIRNPRKAVFMTTKQLAAACKVSEATVVRFVSRLGYEGYSDFLQALREMVNAGMTLQDRVILPALKGYETDRLGQILSEEMENMRKLFEVIDRNGLDAILNRLAEASTVYVAGSRLSYTFAYYMGWSLAKVRKGVHILKGSDSTVVDRLNNAPPGALVVIVATSRYPNELIRLAKLVRRLEQTLVVMADSRLCPLFPFAHDILVVPSQSIPYIGYMAAMSSVISHLVLELAARHAEQVKGHQERLERIYLENDILFNLPLDAKPIG
jgi:DNA-binding MurR/RpiR family transcriptional regulator